MLCFILKIYNKEGQAMPDLLNLYFIFSFYFFVNGKINNNIIQKAKSKNILLSGANFVAGFVVAAAFLSTLIPKFQYWYTRKTTGKDLFPGTYEEEDKKINKNA